MKRVGFKINGIEVILETNKRTKDRNIIVLAKCHCGNEFETDFSSLKRNRVLSCGCSRIKNIIGQKFEKLEVIELTNKRSKSNGSMIWKCKCVCGKVIELSTAELKHPDRRSCGCFKENIITAMKKRSGANHHWYNKNLTEDDRKNTRKSEETYEFSKKVFERDDYTCRKCLKRGGELNAHHMNGWHWAVSERSDINNGITLCEKCHTTFHEIYGYKFNTRKQAIEFIGEKP